MTKARPDPSKAETFASVLRGVGYPPAADVAGEGGYRGADRTRHVVHRFAILPEGGDASGIGNCPTWDAALDWIDAGEARREALDPPLPGCDEPTVAAELGLTAALTPADLQRIRRAFALQNHPDRLHPSRRDNATRRMTLANALIDKALKSKRLGR